MLRGWAISMKWSDLGTSFGWWPQLKTGDIFALRCPSLMGEPDGFESKEYLEFCFAKMAERVGFEPTVRFTARRFSKSVP